MSVEDLLGAQSGQAFNAEQAVAARALLHESQNRVIDLAKRAANDPSYMQGFTRFGVLAWSKARGLTLVLPYFPHVRKRDAVCCYN